MRRADAPIAWALLLAAGLGLAALPHTAFADRETRRTPVVRVVEQAADAVVSISTDERVRIRVDDGIDRYYRRWGRPRHYREGYREAALGSGVILHPDGYVVTNYHVVRRGARIRVHLRDGRELLAKVVGTDPDSDLAVLKVPAGKGLPFLALAKDGDVMLGETVLAIGNPFGLSHTVSTGIVSAVGRNIEADGRTFFDFIQTDASINPGNSGGPLINLDGEVVGINTAIYGEAQGIGFAIPAARVRRVVQDLVDYGEVREPWLGLLVDDIEGSDGVVVAARMRHSPARKIRPGDVILAIDDHPISGRDEYRHRLRDVPVGHRATFTVRRGTRTFTAEVVPTDVPAEAADELLSLRVGIEVGVQRFRDRYGNRVDGLVVASVTRGTPAARVGLAPGDLIRGVNAQPVESQADLRRLVLQAQKGGELHLAIQRGYNLYEVAFKL